jgi:tetratricopeptide (TPR) repeat protein
LTDSYWQSRDTSLASTWQMVKGLCKVFGWNDVRGAWKEAEKTFPLQNQIDYLLYWTSLTLLYVAHGDYVLAESLAKSAGVKWWRLTVRSLIHVEKQECNKTASLADTVLQIGPGYGKILLLYSLAKCQYEQGQLDKAEKYLFQLQRIYDNTYSIRAMYYPKSIYLLGKIYEQKGDSNLALKNYTRFLEIWKNADEDLPALIDAKERLKNLSN